jgi:hypothetical protein
MGTDDKNNFSMNCLPMSKGIPGNKYKIAIELILATFFEVIYSML